MKPKHQTALITGAAKRIGAEIARSLAVAGYDIALHYHHSQKEAEALQAEIQALGRTCHLHACNLEQLDTLESWLSKIFVATPNLNILINNASVFKREHLTEMTHASLSHHMNINAFAPIILSNNFAKLIGKGHIINMLDADVLRNHASHGAYLLSKKTLANHTEMAARAFGPNIQVNAICPGVILPSTENPKDFEERLLDRLPLDRLPNTEDICRSILWLLDQARITGQFIFNDSGQHLL